MKNILNLFLLIGILSLNACDRTLDIVEPQFEMKNVKITNGEDEEGKPVKRVTFEIESEADVISFYSGEVGSDYAYADGRIVKQLGLDLSFSTNCDGAADGQGPDQLSVMASVDFNGNHTEEDINAATWVNIKDRFNYSPIQTVDPGYHPSGTKDISDLLVPSKPLYLAFRYAVQPQQDVGIHNRMRIRDWSIVSRTELGNSIVSTQSTAGWILTEMGPHWRSGRQSLTANQITLRGNHLTGSATPEQLNAYMEAWVVSSQPIYAGDVDLGPDRPMVIKSRENPPLKTFTYEYKDYGEYEAIFILSNVNIKNENKVLKKVKVVIPEDATEVRVHQDYSVIKQFDMLSQTYYYLTRVNHKKHNSELIKLHVANASKPGGETVQEFAVRQNSMLAFNASTQYEPSPGTISAEGIQIIDGIIVQNKPHDNRYTLGIKENNELIVFPPSVTAAQVLQGGVTDALTAFIPLIEDYEPVSDLLFTMVANYTVENPRQVIAQMENLDLLFLSCGGRGYEGIGMTAKDLIRVLKKQNVKFAYMLDGGGSVSTVVGQELITPKIDGDGTQERLRPNFLYFMP